MFQTLFVLLCLGLAPSDGCAAPVTVPVRDTIAAVTFTADRQGGLGSAAPVMTAGAEAIARRGARGLDEVLRTMPGLTVKDYGGVGGLKTVSVRGLGAAHTAVCYDGTAISNAQNGQIDISRFNLDNVASLTVEIGPADEIFRPARTMSSGGVLTVNSKRPDFSAGGTLLKARMRFASFGTYSPGLLLQQKLSDSFSLDASASYTRSEGDYPFKLQNGTSQTMERRTGSEVSILSTEANLRGDLPNGAALTSKVNFYTSQRGLPGAVIFYAQNPTETLWDKALVSAVSYEDVYSNGLKIKSSVGYNLEWNRYLDVSTFYAEPEDDRYLQQEWSASFIGQYSAGEALRFVLAQDLFVNRLSSSIPECPFPTRLSSITSLNAQYRSDRLTVTACLTATAITESVETGEAAPSRFRLSPNVSASWRVAGQLRLRASYKDGFRVPTFNDLYYQRVGNVGLVPEIARQTGLGATWSGSAGRASLSFTADGYWNSVKDKIVAVPTMFVWHMRNLGRVRMLGADVSANAFIPVNDRWTFRLNAGWSWLSAVDLSDPSAKNYGHQIQYTPKHSGNVLASLETPWVNFSYTLVCSGRRWYLPQNVDANSLAPYFDHSISLNRDFRIRRTGMNVAFEALNLGNVNYEVIHSYPMPGRNYRLTITISK